MLVTDNPFGVFPGTKKDAEQKRKTAEEARSRSRVETPADRPALATSPRSPTSVGPWEARINKQNFGGRRPFASHSRRPQSLEDNPALFDNLTFDGPYSPADNMPLHKKRPSESEMPYDGFGATFQPETGQSGPSQLNFPLRPAPQKSATGPAPHQEPLLPGDIATPRDQTTGTTNRQNQRSKGAPQNFSRRRRDNVVDQPHNSALDYANADRPWNQADEQNFTRESESRAGYGDIAYKNVKLSKSMTNLGDPSVPNFAAMPPNATENIEKQVTLQSQTQYPAYRKPTYGVAPAAPQPQGQPLGDRPTSGPVGENSKGAPVTPGSVPQGIDMSYDTRNDYQRLPAESGHPKFPPRMGSRPDPRPQGSAPGFKPPYNKPNQPRRPPHYQQTKPDIPHYNETGYTQGRRAPRQDYGFDHQGQPSGGNQNQNPYLENRGFDQYPDQQTYQQEAPILTRSQTEPVHQPYEDQYHQAFSSRDPSSRTQTFNDGYNQYVQSPSQGRRTQQNGHLPLNRPRTANSTQPPGNQYPDSDMRGSQPPKSTLPVADRNHPIPVRPGLMNPASGSAPPPRVSPAYAQREVRRQDAPQNTAMQKTPVTVRELNELRDAFRNNPGDDRLGLRFAKKLVEAATVLASEGGRADAKQTARNRERYIDDAYKIVKKLASNGSSEAMFYLADCYGTGQLGLEVNPKEAFQLYTSASKAGHAQASYRVAVCCEMGPDGGGGTRRDPVKAMQFYKKAATLGDGPAMFKMGAILMKGLLGQPANRREGVQWLKRAAERADAENPHSLHELGKLYENATPNDVILKDERYAIELYTRAANLGYKHSQTRLGSAFEYGLMGCPIDPQKSIMWYSKAAAQGEHLAEFALSGWYLTGAPPLLEANDQEAYLWARKAAASGLAKAEYAMGYYTETGIGIAPNVEEAKKWYFRAAGKCNLIHGLDNVLTYL